MVIGDCHGHFTNLRSFLIEQGAINEDNQRINRDSLRVYCTGDLIDGGVNRTGDLLILEYASEWFDEIVIGNHEWPFFGGLKFMGLRQHDRELMLKLMQLEAEGKYVPSTVVNDTLLVHGGLAKRWSFKSAQDANDVLRMLWDTSQEETKDIPMLDWIGPARTKYANETGGIFWLDWEEDRNTNFNQVVGHSTYVNGPLVVHYANGVEHWNIDVGGKYGYSLGGVIIEEGQPTKPVFWGSRIRITYKKPTDEELTVEDEAEDLWENDDLDPDGTEMWQELMETV